MIELQDSNNNNLMKCSFSSQLSHMETIFRTSALCERFNIPFGLVNPKCPSSMPAYNIYPMSIYAMREILFLVDRNHVINFGSVFIDISGNGDIDSNRQYVEQCINQDGDLSYELLNRFPDLCLMALITDFSELSSCETISIEEVRSLLMINNDDNSLLTRDLRLKVACQNALDYLLFKRLAKKLKDSKLFDDESIGVR